MNIAPEDSKIGTAVLAIVALSGVAALVAFFRTAWPGSSPVYSASRPESLLAARMVWSVGFGAAALLIGLRKPSAIPVTLRGYGLALLLAVIICCSNWIATEDSPVSEQMDWPAVALFVAPAVGMFVAGTLVRWGLAFVRAEKP